MERPDGFLKLIGREIKSSGLYQSTNSGDAYMDNDVKEIVLESWNKWSSDYDSYYPHTIKSAKEDLEWKNTLKKLVGNKVQNILDVGTGTGFLAIDLTEMGHKVNGIDLSEGMLKEAERKAKDRNLEIQFVIGDVEELDEPDNSYDIVINRFILWTMQYPEKAIREWTRVLKPGGRLIVIDGMWFDKKLSYQVEKFLGNLLILFTEFKNPWKKTTYFEGNLKERLPFTKNKNACTVNLIFKKCGLKDVKVTELVEVEKEEKKVMSLKELLLNPYRKIVIEGVKPE